MKAIMPKPFTRLSQSEKNAIYRAVANLANKQTDKEEAELQKIWLQYACIVLHNAFGFGKSRLLQFLGNWKRMYRTNTKLGNYETQQEYLKAEMSKIFGECGYPYEWIDSLEDLNGK